MNKNFTIFQYSFNSDVAPIIINNHRDYISWPIVYFLENRKSKEAYVGETTDILNRMKAHLKNEKKQNLSSVNLILSELFNKSATLDLESHLIRYISADGFFKLQNGNLGISNHNYHQQKEIYWLVFREIWDELCQLGIARHSLEYIDNSDLFKYSPYKTLSKEQITGLKMIFHCLLDDRSKVSLIHGGAGTGKSILAIFLFKLLKTDLSDFNYVDFDEEDEDLLELLKRVKEKFGELKMALVIPMASFRKTISNVFKNIKGLSHRMVIGPSDLALQPYDLIIVDEGHRLRRRVNLGPYFSVFDKTSESLGLDKYTSSELDWVLIQSKKVLIFYDQCQSIKPSDIAKDRFQQLKNEEWTRNETLKTQFRVRGGNKYVAFIHALLSDSILIKSKFNSIDYEVYLYNDLNILIGDIRKRDTLYGLSRLVAGYAWEWVSKKNDDLYDIVIKNTNLKWNSVAIDWINFENSVNEVGCIHTTQGYDLNYTGVIIGPELDYDIATKSLIVYRERYKDKNGKNSIKDEKLLKEYILNIYKTLLLRGIKGTFIYCCNENLRKHLSQFFNTKDEVSPKTSIKIVESPNTNTVPYYNLRIAAGGFSNLQKSEDVQYIELADGKSYSEYFACQVIGQSMNKIIPDGSICLFEKYSGGSRNGLITLVKMTNYLDADFGSNYTIKEYHSKKTTSEDGWKHEEIILYSRSSEIYEPIILRDEEIVNLRVIGLFIKVLS